MDKIIIKLELKGSAFDEYPGMEAARILRDLADRIENMTQAPDGLMMLHDVNGNAVTRDTGDTAGNGIQVRVVGTAGKTSSQQLLDNHLIFKGFDLAHLVGGKFGHDFKVILDIMQVMNGITAKNNSINDQSILIELCIIGRLGFLSRRQGLKFCLAHVLIGYNVGTDNILDWETT